MSVSLDKITDCTTERDNLIMRGVPVKITATSVTFKITKAWGLWSGVDYTSVTQGRKITAPIGDCDLYRQC